MPEGGTLNMPTSSSGQGIFSHISRKSRRTLWILILLLSAAGGYLFLTRNQGVGVAREANETKGENQLDRDFEPTALPSTTTESPATEPVLLFGDANYRSENFRVGDIAIGGEAAFLLTEDTPEPLTISAIRGETFTEKNDQEVKLVLSWTTNKLSVSEVAYSKGIGQPTDTVRKDAYALNHSIILSGLDPGATYVYTIAAEDRFGTRITSNTYAVYTGAQSVSLFDLIADAVGEVFGWAIQNE